MALSNVPRSPSGSRSYTLTRYYQQQGLQKALEKAGTPTAIVENPHELAAYAEAHFAPDSIAAETMEGLKQLRRRLPDLRAYNATEVIKRAARRTGGEQAAKQARARGVELDAELVANFLAARAKNSQVTISSWSATKAGRYKAVDGSGRPLSAKSLQRRLTRALKDAQALSA
jgi:hypothetical protein